MAENNSINDGFTVNVNSPGNFIAREITFSGTVNFGYGNTESGGFSDEQIAQAITAICGKGKPLCTKRKWAGVYWCLRWYCNFPPGVPEFCAKVKELPLGKLEFECEYNSIRHDCTLSFMDENPRYMDKVRYSNMDTDTFMQCREVVLALVSELGRASLPRVEI